MKRLLTGLLATLALAGAYLLAPAAYVAAQNTACYMAQGGATWTAGSGCTWTAASGSTVDLSASTLTLPALSTLSATTARFQLSTESATLSSNAATITHYAAKITTESLTTAHTATQALVITKVGVVTGDYVMISMVGGSNTGGVPVFNAVATTDTVTITLRNNAIATNAFNGTFIFNMIIFKA